MIPAKTKKNGRKPKNQCFSIWMERSSFNFVKIGHMAVCKLQARCSPETLCTPVSVREWLSQWPIIHLAIFVSKRIIFKMSGGKRTDRKLVKPPNMCVGAKTIRMQRQSQKPGTFVQMKRIVCTFSTLLIIMVRFT